MRLVCPKSKLVELTVAELDLFRWPKRCPNLRGGLLHVFVDVLTGDEVGVLGDSYRLEHLHKAHLGVEPHCSRVPERQSEVLIKLYHGKLLPSRRKLECSGRC